MPYTGTQANADLKRARDGLSDYLETNEDALTAEQQNTLLDSITVIDQKRSAIATMGALDALDPTGNLFPKVTQATSTAKTTLDALAATEKDIAKAITIATDVVTLATAVASMDVPGFASSVLQLTSDATPGD